MSTDDAPGWDSLEHAFAGVYGEEPEHRAPPISEQPPAEGGVLNGISAYRGEAHWHLVSFGFTDLFGLEPGGETSGWGHELTLITPPAERPPDWAFSLLMAVAGTARAAGRPFHAGARLAPGAPLDGAGSALTAVGLRTDPLVTPTLFPSGAYELLQVVGLTPGEYGVMRKVGTALVLEKLAVRDPLLRLDPARGQLAP